MTSNDTKIAWIGAGKMGLPMLGHLLKAGYPVRVCDTSAARIAAAVARGAIASHSPKTAATGASVIFSSLPNDTALTDVALNPDGVFAGAAADAVFIDTSTVSPAASALVATAAKAKDIGYLRATVSGNNVVAEAAELTVMASGPRAVYDAVLPLLQHFSARQFYVGPAEEARLMKLVINLMISVSAGMMAEALTLGRSGGLDWQQMLEVMESSAVASPMVRYKAPPLKARDFSSTMSVIAQTKDIDLILDAARSKGVPMALTGTLRQMYQAMISQGGGDEDYIAIVKHVEQSAGLGTDKASVLRQPRPAPG